MKVPPGLVYLSQAFLSALPLSVLVYAVLNAVSSYTDVSIQGWVIVAFSLLSRPLWVIAADFWVEYKSRKEATLRGAVFVPSIPGTWPGGMSIINTIVKSFNSGYPGDAFLEWSKSYGRTFHMKVVAENRIFTFEPDHIKAILATHFDDFEKGSTFFDQFHSLLGTGVFNSDGDMWKFHRTITRPFFSKERISHFDVFESHANDAINQATNRLAEGHPIDFQDLVSRFTLDSATEFLFGSDVQCLSAGLPYPAASPLAAAPAFVNHTSNRFVNAFLAAQELTALRARYGPAWPLFEFWKNRVRPHREVIDAFVDPMIDEALARGGEKGDERGEDTLLDSLISQTQDRQILKDELTNLLVAARDTTASTLTFAMYMMTQHPEMAQRIREEVLQTVGYERPTYEHMKSMKYLRAFINETLRLYPPVPFNSRTANKNTVWESKSLDREPVFVPAGTRCMYSVFLMHRRKDLWGPDALEFDPGRFLDSRLQKYLTPNPFIFLPFNAGPRICLGQQFAYHETSFFLIRLLQKFVRFSLAGDAQPQDSLPDKDWVGCEGPKGRDKIRLKSHLTMFVKGGLWIRMEEAKKTESDSA